MHKDHTKVLLGECPICGHKLQLRQRPPDHAITKGGARIFYSFIGPRWYSSEDIYDCPKCEYEAKIKVTAEVKGAVERDEAWLAEEMKDVVERDEEAYLAACRRAIGLAKSTIALPQQLQRNDADEAHNEPTDKQRKHYIIVSQDKEWWTNPETDTVVEVADEQWERLLYEGLEKVNLKHIGKCSDIIEAGVANSK